MAGGLEHHGRPTAGLAGSDWLLPILVPEREEAKAVIAARARRLAERLQVRVRRGGRLHRIELAGGRLADTYTIPRFSGNCKAATALIGSTIPGPGNTISVTLGPIQLG